MDRINRMTFLRRNEKVEHDVTLHYRSIYILPCKNGLSFAIVLFVMLVGSMNYNLSLGYLLVFLLGGMTMASILHTFRNLLGLKISTGRNFPCHAGSRAGYSLYLESTTGRPLSGLFIINSTGESEMCDLPASGKTAIHIKLPAPHRGMQALGNITLFTVYPLGLFRAWSVINFASECAVYPRPAESTPTPLTSNDDDGIGSSIETTQGHDDFSGLRQYHPGDSLKHVAWKAVARGQGMLTKQFTGLGRATSWLDWQQLHDILPEQRLSILCKWILDADSADSEYGLRLPNLEIPPNKGPAHKQRCLTALATFDVKTEIKN